MTRTEPRTTATLPPVSLTPEEAAAVAVALAAQPDGPYASDGRAALEKVLEVLEPDTASRARLLALTDVGAPPADRQSAVRASTSRHPAGRALGTAATTPATPPRLVLLPGGRA